MSNLLVDPLGLYPLSSEVGLAPNNQCLSQQPQEQSDKGLEDINTEEPGTPLHGVKTMWITVSIATRGSSSSLPGPLLAGLLENTFLGSKRDQD